MAFGTQMTVDQFVLNAYLLATGKAVPPTFGAAKYTKLLALANYFTTDWSGQPDVDWNSQRSMFTVSGGVTATDTFTIPSTVNYISRQEGDYVRIVNLAGTKEYDYTIVPPARLYRDWPSLNSMSMGTRNANGTCAVVGSSLVFDRAFTASDPQFGGTIKIPGFIIPPVLVNALDKITVDNPLWLVCRVAAEYIRNDITRVQLYGSLVDQANEQMVQMKVNNMSQVESVYAGSWSPAGDNFDDYPWT